MICPKCNTRQYLEGVYTDQGTRTVWRCFGCEHSIDPVFLLRKGGRERKGMRGTRRLLFFCFIHRTKRSSHV